MEFKNHVVFRRRSIRDFTDQPVDEEQIKILLEAAQAAPSAGNAQPWCFWVISDKYFLSRISQEHPYAKMTEQAALGILVCGKPDEEKYRGFWVQDCSAAVMNILIEVEELNLGAVWVGVYPNEQYMDIFKKILDIPDATIPFAFIPIGHKAKEKPPSDRYDENKVRYV